MTVDAIDAASKHAIPPPAAKPLPLVKFDTAAMEPPSLGYLLRHPKEALIGWGFETLLVSYPQPLLRLLRWLGDFSIFGWRIFGLRPFGPVIYLPPPFGGRYFAVRYDQVREILLHDREFPVPWKKKMMDITKGRNFVLGMERDAEYRRCYTELAKAFPLSDVESHIAMRAATEAERIVAEVAHTPPCQFDAVKELITEVPTVLCKTYYGIRIQDHFEFARWALALSSDTFGNYEDGARQTPLAQAASANLSLTIRDSIKAPPPEGVVLKRFKEAKLHDDAIYAHFLGMVMGFIPTNVLAGGNILETLLRRPDFMERTRAAALADDDELLWRCLRETLRFRHVNPTPERRCANGYTFDRGGPDEYTVPIYAIVDACIQSAMFDERRIERPHVFDPHRREEDYMTFSIGQHWCIGAYIAKAQLTQTFKPLLKRKGLRAVGDGRATAARFNHLFPLHLNVEFDP